jgi:acyl-CoA dehydrogenase
MNSPEFPPLLQAARRIAREIAAPAAAAVDRDARFPHEAVAALKEARLLSAAVPTALGGGGLSLLELGKLCHALAQGCASTGMVLAMHTIQVGCIARHAGDNAFFAGVLRTLASEQMLLASMTSENGTFGETRRSICAIEDTGDGRFRLGKDATAGSYNAQADAILVTARRNPDAAHGDQVLAYVKRTDCTLQQVGGWDTLGMRGTCSPGFRLDATAPLAQILPADYATISALSMVPYSHVLWAALWAGIAADAHARAASFVRGQARRNPGTTPPTALRLAELTVKLQALRHHWMQVASEFDALPLPADTPAGEGHALARIGWALKFNSLKTDAAERTPEIVHGALQIVGILGYKNDTPFSLGRHYRDALSAALMVSNDRIAAQSASLLLVFKDDQE